MSDRDKMVKWILDYWLVSNYGLTAEEAERHRASAERLVNDTIDSALDQLEANRNGRLNDWAYDEGIRERR